MTGAIMRVMKKRESTGFPTQLKGRTEQGQHAGRLFHDEQVHYKRDFPARLGALAYTQRNQVETVPGQERHLPHELGHVVQQKLGAIRANAIHSGEVVQRANIYRGMRDDGAGRPMLGDTARTLGARRDTDITIHPNDMVHPDEGGMSASTSIEGLPAHRRRDPVWHMDTDNLPQALKYVPDGDRGDRDRGDRDRGTHGTVQPTAVMGFNTYQQHIHGTQAQWHAAGG